MNEIIVGSVAVAEEALVFSYADILHIAFEHAKQNAQREATDQGLAVVPGSARVRVLYEVEAK